jgi:hypothetical protein
MTPEKIHWIYCCDYIERIVCPEADENGFGGVLLYWQNDNVEDTTGKGHSAHVVSETDSWAMVQLGE